MTKPTRYRGHWIIERDVAWFYVDTGSPVADDPERACGACNKPNRPDGHDACLGELPSVMNACCGHGAPGEAYVQWPNRLRVGGRLARLVQLVARRPEE